MAHEDNEKTSGVVRAIAWRPSDTDPMREVAQCRVEVNTGIVGEHRKPGKRSVTLIASEQWTEVCAELDRELNWTTRRANFLVEGVDLSATIGKPLMLGTVRVWIHGESRPCALMDRQYQGLRAVLAARCRGGVFGQVLTGGTVRVGDPVTIVQA